MDELVDEVAGDQRGRSLLRADEVDQGEGEHAGEDRPGQYVADGDAERNRPGVRDGRLGHGSRLLGITRPCGWGCDDGGSDFRSRGTGHSGAAVPEFRWLPHTVNNVAWTLRGNGHPVNAANPT